MAVWVFQGTLRGLRTLQTDSAVWDKLVCAVCPGGIWGLLAGFPSPVGPLLAVH